MYLYSACEQHQWLSGWPSVCVCLSSSQAAWLAQLSDGAPGLDVHPIGNHHLPIRHLS
jgi:hypothetical protein